MPFYAVNLEDEADMGWEQRAEYRYRSMADGSCEMAWQPTSVYVADPSSQTFTNAASMRRKDNGEGAELLLFPPALLAAVLACHYAGHFIEGFHLSVLPHRILMGVTAVTAFCGAVVLLNSIFSGRLIKVAGLLACAGYLLLPVLRHFFQ